MLGNMHGCCRAEQQQQQHQHKVLLQLFAMRIRKNWKGIPLYISLSIGWSIYWFVHWMIVLFLSIHSHPWCSPNMIDHVGPNGPGNRRTSAWLLSWTAKHLFGLQGMFPSLTLPCFFKTHWWLHCMMSFMFFSMKFLMMMNWMKCL